MALQQEVRRLDAHSCTARRRASYLPAELLSWLFFLLNITESP